MISIYKNKSDLMTFNQLTDQICDQNSFIYLYSKKMAYAIVPSQNIFALVYSIIALALVVPCCFLLRKYFRLLDFLQITLAFALAFGTQITSFSNQPTKTWLDFIPNFLTFCQTGGFICKCGGLLSFTICLVGSMIILWIIVQIEKCRRPELRYQPLFKLLKGFIRWSYFPLLYYAFNYLIFEIKLNQDQGTTFTFTTDVIARIVVIAILVIFPFFQLLYNKLIQKEDENIWIKWLQLFNYLRLVLIAALINISSVLNNNIPSYFIYGPLVGYAVIYLFKDQFEWPIVGRIIFLVGQLAFITIFSLFKFKPSFVHDYDLDLFLLSGVLVIDVFYFLVLTVRLVRGQQRSKVNPQDTMNRQNLRPNVNEPGYLKAPIHKINIESEQQFQNNNKYQKPNRNKK